MSFLTPSPLTLLVDRSRADKALAGRVTVGDASVTVDLSNRWRSGGEMVVVLRNVKAAVPRFLSERPTDGVPYEIYPVTVKSKRSGSPDRLDPVAVDHDGVPATAMKYVPPVVRVGNILGIREDDNDGKDGVQHYGRDTIARDFTITPDVVYEAETDETFKVSFKANGPMYSTAYRRPGLTPVTSSS